MNKNEEMSIKFDQMDALFAPLEAKWKKRREDPNGDTLAIHAAGKNCLSYWFPIIHAAGVPVPNTRYIAIGNAREIGAALFDAKDSNAVRSIADVLSGYADDTTGWPCFLRTGYFSGKHDWENTCFVKSREDMLRNMAMLANMQEMVGAGGHNGLSVWVVREMLPTTPHITCERYGDFPVTRELRVFVDGADVRYSVPYWPEGAIEDGKPRQSDWRDRMRAVTTFTRSERDEIHELASRCGKACGGRWSVDVLDTNKGWYVTDMAVAEGSYGYEPAKYATTESK